MTNDRERIEMLLYIYQECLFIIGIQKKGRRDFSVGHLHPKINNTGHRQYTFRRENRESTSCLPTQNVKLSSTRRNVPRTLQVTTTLIYSQDLIAYQTNMLLLDFIFPFVPFFFFP